MKTKVDDRIRLSLAVTPQVKGRLDRLLEQTEAESITEVIRRALAIYEELVEVKRSGGRVVLESKTGAREAIRVF